MHNKLFRLLSTLALTVGLFSATADAALVGRDLDGNLATAEAYYDTVTNLTWLADANYAWTSDYDPNGLMDWADANAWATGLDIDGVAGLDGWRLPTALNQGGSGPCVGVNCTGSEMGNLFYTVLGNTVVSLSNTGPFSNVQSFNYWSATEFAPGASDAWYFGMDTGFQHITADYVNYYAWAVQSGDFGVAVSAVPIPAAVWLFGSGLIGLIGVARRRKNS